jgi:hypothetical protein
MPLTWCMAQHHGIGTTSSPTYTAYLAFQPHPFPHQVACRCGDHEPASHGSFGCHHHSCAPHHTFGPSTFSIALTTLVPALPRPCMTCHSSMLVELSHNMTVTSPCLVTAGLPHPHIHVVAQPCYATAIVRRLHPHLRRALSTCMVRCSHSPWPNHHEPSTVLVFSSNTYRHLSPLSLSAA